MLHFRSSVLQKSEMESNVKNVKKQKKIPCIFEKSCRGYIFVGKISYTLFHAFSLLKSRVILLLPFSRFQLYKRRRPPDISL